MPSRPVRVAVTTPARHGGTPPASGTGAARTDPSRRTADEVARELGTDPDHGLGDAEAARRLAAEGSNELRATPPVGWWRRVLAQLRDPLVLLLLVAAAISLVVWSVDGGHGLPVDVLVITAVVVVNAALGLVQESRAEHAVAALASMTEATSTVLRDGRYRTVPSAHLVRGDVLALSEGDAVGADARLVHATALRVLEASLTGESAAVSKDPATLRDDVPLGDRTDMVFKGTAVVQGVGRAVVTATGMRTEMGAIAEMLDATEEEPTPLQRETAAIGRRLGLVVIVVAAVVMVVTGLVNQVSTLPDLVTVLLLGVSLAVAAVPESLPAILSVVLAVGVLHLARRRAVVKTLHSVEALGSASVIASDKTGTLTRNEMTVERIVTASGEVRLTGAGDGPSGGAHARQAPPYDDASPDDTAGPHTAAPQDAGLAAELRRLLAGAALANNARLVEQDGHLTAHGDPTESALLLAARTLPGAGEPTRFERHGEVPFTSERKLMSVAGDLAEPVTGHVTGRATESATDRPTDEDAGAPTGPRAPGDRVLFTKGAPDVLLERCTHLQVGDDVVPLDPARRAAVAAAVERLSGQAYRTLGVAYRHLPRDVAADALERHETGLVHLGVAGLIDPPRPEVTQAVRQAHRAGIRVVMITGDHPATASRIAEDLGVVAPGSPVVTGADLDRLDADGLRAATRAVSVYARVAPQHKLRIVDALQADGQVVAVTGDGVNDAPALKSADIGVAMGITGTEVTKESATMILADDNFATIVAAVRQGRVIVDNLTKCLRHLLSSNMGEVFTVFLGVVLADAVGLTAAAAEGTVVVPLLATQILWINLVTDSAPALALGLDPEVDDVMGRPPRDLSERLVGPRLWTAMLSVGLTMGLASLLAMDLFLPGGLIPGDDSLEVARTAGFTTLVLAQFLYVFSARSGTASAFRRLFTNRWLWGSVALGVALQVAVVHVPFLQTAFGTAPLRPVHWAVAAALAVTVLAVEELRKLVLRRRAAPVRRRAAAPPGAEPAGTTRPAHRR